MVQGSCESNDGWRRSTSLAQWSNFGNVGGLDGPLMQNEDSLLVSARYLGLRKALLVDGKLESKSNMQFNDCLLVAGPMIRMLYNMSAGLSSHKK